MQPYLLTIIMKVNASVVISIIPAKALDIMLFYFRLEFNKIFWVNLEFFFVVPLLVSLFSHINFILPCFRYISLDYFLFFLLHFLLKFFLKFGFQFIFRSRVLFFLWFLRLNICLFFILLQSL